MQRLSQVISFARSTVSYVMGCICSKCTFMTSPGHNTVKGMVPNRIQPNSTVFPNFMQNQKGMWLYWRDWWPRGRSIEGVVFFVGGFGEHHVRYDSHAARFNARGYVCFFLDHQGHGASEGVRKYAEAFQDYINDYKQFVDERLMMPLVPDYAKDDTAPSSRQLVGDLPNRFILGHSLGGLMTIRLCMQNPDLFKAAIISSPALEVDPELATPFLRNVAKFLSNHIPKWQLDKPAADKCSRNPQIVLQMENDYMMSSEVAARARTANEVLQTQDDTFNNLHLVTFNFLLLHGDVDKVCRIEGSHKFFEKTRANYSEANTNYSSTNSKKRVSAFKVYEGVFHEPFTDEPKMEEVYQDVFSFIASLEEKSSSPKFEIAGN